MLFTSLYQSICRSLSLVARPRLSLQLPRWSLVLSAAVMGYGHSTQAQMYSASFNDSQWAAQSGAFACSLSHTIPGFGNARFTRNAGAAELLELRHTSKAFPAGSVRIESFPPVWRSEVSPALLGQVNADGGASALKVTAHLESIAGTLEQGTNVVFSSAPRILGDSGGGSNMRVALEARNFSSAYSQYRKCIANLIPYTFDQLSRTVINYSRDADGLSAAAKAQLDKIIRYAKADPRVLGILIDAHSDVREDPAEGEAAAQLQAEWVADYLVEKGLSADTLTTRWHGDKFPVASNKDKSGQAKNRRVTLRLENASTRKEMEKKVAAIKQAEQKAAEEAAAKAAAESSSGVSASSLPVNLQQLEQMVEQQDLTSGKQLDGGLMR